MRFLDSFRADDDNYFQQPETVEKHIANCAKADPAYGDGVRKSCEAFGAL